MSEVIRKNSATRNDYRAGELVCRNNEKLTRP